MSGPAEAGSGHESPAARDSGKSGDGHRVCEDQVANNDEQTMRSTTTGVSKRWSASHAVTAQEPGVNFGNTVNLPTRMVFLPAPVFLPGTRG